VTGDEGEVRVTVTVHLAPLGPLPLAVTVSGSAVALREPGSAGDAG
jgi:Fe2+ transport system protein FeoA